MIGIEVHTSGDTKWIAQTIARTEAHKLQARVFSPWQYWVMRKRIPDMYAHKGIVSGSDGQMAWPALSKWTIASKGVFSFMPGQQGKRGIASTSPMVSADNNLMKSYRIAQKRVGTTEWEFELSNAARSRSKWSRGFDYASALHRGWGPYEVRPKNAKVLAWPMARGTVVSGSLGRRGSEGTIFQRGFARRLNKGFVVNTNMAVAKSTHPSGAPARPHIRWFGVDLQKLGKLASDFIMTGRVSP